MKFKIEIPNIRKKNLIPYPFTNARNFNKSYASCGISFIDNGDGSITVNGECKQAIAFYSLNALNPIPIKSHTQYTLSGCPQDCDSIYGDYKIVACIRKDPKYIPRYDCSCDKFSDNTFLHNEDAYLCDIAIVIFQGAKFNNVIFNPQLEQKHKKSSFEKVTWREIEIYTD